MTKYLVTVRDEEFSNYAPIFSFDEEIKRADFIRAIKERDSSIEFATSEMEDDKCI